MSCCDDGENPPTVRHLIHELSAYWVDQNQPVYISVCDPSGNPMTFVVTGVTTTARGQELTGISVDED